MRGMMGSRPQPKTRAGRALVIGLCATAVCAFTCQPPPDEGAVEGPGPAGPVASSDDAPRSRFPRLSHVQFDNAVRDLFALPGDVDVPRTLRPDPASGGTLFVDYGRLRVDTNLMSDYRHAAEDVAATLTGDETLLTTLAPGGRPEAERLDTFLAVYAKRAHRRPVAEEDLDAYRGLFAEGAALAPDDNARFAHGLRPVIEALLLSPYFIYRPELSEGGSLEAPAPLDDHEVAARLSFALWDSIPDDELLAAADEGQLSTADEVEAQAARLLDDPRAVRVAQRFFGRLFDVERYRSVQPPEEFGRSASFGADLVREHELIVESLFTTDRGLRDLLTTTETFVNQELADVYGLGDDFGRNFRLATLEPAQRRGILTTLGFLAKNSAGFAPDPIHRGVFVATRLVCLTVPAPPDNIPPLPAPDGETNRELVEQATQQEGSSCAGCHASLINPFGFPFEQYDAVGRYRVDDNGQAIDPSSLVLLGSDGTAVDDALELADALAEAPEVHRCHTSWWLSHLFGRAVARTDDRDLLDAVAAQSLDDDASFRSLIVALVRSDAFRSRPPEVRP